MDSKSDEYKVMHLNPKKNYDIGGKLNPRWLIA